MLRTFASKHAFSGTIGRPPVIVPVQNPWPYNLVASCEFWQGASTMYEQTYNGQSYFYNHSDLTSRIVGYGDPRIEAGDGFSYGDSLALEKTKGAYLSKDVPTLKPWNETTGAGITRTYMLWTYVSTIRSNGPLITIVPDTALLTGSKKAIYIGASAFNWSMYAVDSDNVEASYTTGSPNIQYAKRLITMRVTWGGNITIHIDKNPTAVATFDISSLGPINQSGNFRVAIGGATFSGGWGHTMRVGAFYAYDINLQQFRVDQIYDGTVNNW